MSTRIAFSAKWSLSSQVTPAVARPVAGSGLETTASLRPGAAGFPPRRFGVAGATRGWLRSMPWKATSRTFGGTGLVAT